EHQRIADHRSITRDKIAGITYAPLESSVVRINSLYLSISGELVYRSLGGRYFDSQQLLCWRVIYQFADTAYDAFRCPPRISAADSRCLQSVFSVKKDGVLFGYIIDEPVQHFVAGKEVACSVMRIQADAVCRLRTHRIQSVHTYEG